VALAGTVVQGGHAEIQRQTAFLLKACHRPDLPRELCGADRAKSSSTISGRSRQKGSFHVWRQTCRDTIDHDAWRNW
jgi:hypothetical protein